MRFHQPFWLILVPICMGMLHVPLTFRLTAVLYLNRLSGSFLTLFVFVLVCLFVLVQPYGSRLYWFALVLVFSFISMVRVCVCLAIWLAFVFV